MSTKNTNKPATRTFTLTIAFIVAQITITSLFFSAQAVATSGESTATSDESRATTEHSLKSTITWRFDAGLSVVSKRLHEDLFGDMPSFESPELGTFFGFAVDKKLTNNQQANSAYIGTKIEFHQIDGNILTTVRALDYKQHINEEWLWGAFVGGARYDFRSPAYGYTFGGGLFYRPESFVGNWGAAIELQYLDKLARDKIHPDDPSVALTGPDSFADMQIIAFSVNYYF